MFGMATITLGIGPHFYFFFSNDMTTSIFRAEPFARLYRVACL